MQQFVNTHVITYRGHQRQCTSETYQDVIDQLIKEHGEPNGEIPEVKLLEGGVKVPQPFKTAGANDDLPGNVSLSGKFRSEADEIAAIDNGFAPAKPIYSIGTRVVQLGVDNARESQEDHAKKPSARDVALALVRQVQAECRQDLPPILVNGLYMTSKGKVALPGPNGDPGQGRRLDISKRAFTSLFGRFPCASGIRYLESCPSRLRSINFNHWSDELRRIETAEKHTDKAAETVFRTRKVGDATEIYASVSPSYTAFDADKIGKALAQAFPSDAKGVLNYDGYRTRVEGLWHTDVAPNQFVAGEFFKAGVIIRTDDAGGGSIRVQSVLWRNLCLNLIILDKAIGVDIRIKHTGSVEELAKRFRAAFNQALGSIEPFRKAWGAAFSERDEVLKARVQGTTSEDLSLLPITAVLPGIFNGILERDLVPLPGRRRDIVPKLLEMHAQDEAADAYGVSRASIVNAFTRYAHVVESDPFVADEIRAGAGALLSSKAGKAPAPLPYIAIATAV